MSRFPYVPPDEDLPDGSFVRAPYVFREVIDAEPERYDLYVSLACPWAQRAAIVRELGAFTDVVRLVVVDPIRDERGWRIEDDPNGFTFLSEAYHATDPSFGGRPTVPVLWDRVERRVVTNNFHDIPDMLARAYAGDVASGLFPDHRAFDETVERLYLRVNDGVYKCGFAQSQSAYDHAVEGLFDERAMLDERLSAQRYLMGAQITAADIHLFATLVRFDCVYHTHFRCNRRRVIDYDHLWPYARDLYQVPAFQVTTDFDHITRHYYMTHPGLNPSGIVPVGPDLDWTEPHGRG